MNCFDIVNLRRYMGELLILALYIGALIYSVVIHEVAHGAIANSLGDSTAKDLGRLTLNPFKHLDAFGSVILPIMLLIFRAPFIIGYAKPVPYNPENLRNRKWDPVKVAVAGPLSNIVLALLAGMVLRFGTGVFVDAAVINLFQYILSLNLVLAFFNLFPIPPLDGHWLLMAFLPARYYALKMFLYRYSFILLFVFLIFIFPYFAVIIGSLASLISGI